jgi:hypothetical protein
MKVWKSHGACAQEISYQKDILRIFMNFYGTAQKSISGSNFPKSYLPPIRGSSWHKKQNKNDKERSLQ